jgi:hypothetical protein
MTALTEMSSSRLWRNFHWKTEKVSGGSFREYKVTTQNGVPDPFITRKGLRVGDVLSCMLFNIALEKAVIVAGLDIRRTILHSSNIVLCR